MPVSLFKLLGFKQIVYVPDEENTQPKGDGDLQEF